MALYEASLMDVKLRSWPDTGRSPASKKSGLLGRFVTPAQATTVMDLIENACSDACTGLSASNNPTK
ncbi:hypothetical protein H5410_041783 [Solanum commersonii]|uniref:Uncharacterized protein n=1 Tax=Solanum commersonii TaxID=4109 RepID=A0A9J5XTV1_SOLCO|nr:hypothetical protein H5410_041783 [Solanum commersonii]